MGRPHLMRSKLWTENDSWCLLCRKLDRPYSHKNREFVPCFKYVAVPSNSLFFQGETTTKKWEKDTTGSSGWRPGVYGLRVEEHSCTHLHVAFQAMSKQLAARIRCHVWCFILNPTMLVNGKCFMISSFLHQFLHICHNSVFAFDWGTLIATQLIPKTTVFAINNWWNSRILHVLLKAHWTALVAHWPWQAQPNGPIGRKVRPSRLAECESQRCLVGLKLRLVDGSIFYESFIISSYISMGIKLKPRYIWYMFIFYVLDPRQNWNHHISPFRMVYWSMLAIFCTLPSQLW